MIDMIDWEKKDIICTKIVSDLLPEHKTQSNKYINKTKKSVTIVLNLFVDSLPMIWLIKNTPSFVKSLKSEERKIEIYKMLAILWSTPIDAAYYYELLIDNDLANSLWYSLLGKIVYYSLYIKYLSKKENFNLKDFLSNINNELILLKKSIKRLQNK